MKSRGAEWGGGGAFGSIPQFQVNQNSLDDCPVLQETDDLHRAVTLWADERICVVDFLYSRAQLLRHCLRNESSSRCSMALARFESHSPDEILRPAHWGAHHAADKCQSR